MKLFLCLLLLASKTARSFMHLKPCSNRMASSLVVEITPTKFHQISLKLVPPPDNAHEAAPASINEDQDDDPNKQGVEDDPNKQDASTDHKESVAGVGTTQQNFVRRALRRWKKPRLFSSVGEDGIGKVGWGVGLGIGLGIGFGLFAMGGLGHGLGKIGDGIGSAGEGLGKIGDGIGTGGLGIGDGIGTGGLGIGEGIGTAGLRIGDGIGKVGWGVGLGFGFGLFAIAAAQVLTQGIVWPLLVVKQ